MNREEYAFLKDELVKWRRPSIDTLIHYVTSLCNASCDHCYFLDRLNQKNDLKPDETLQIIKRLGPLKAVLLAGGEPFLCKHLTEVLTAYVRECGVQFAQIPTMAFHSERIQTALDAVLSACPALNLTVNVSLDGFEEFHDGNRHVRGLFKKVLANLRLMLDMKRRYPKLRVCVVSVMMPQNFADLRRLAEFVRDEVDPDLHILEVMRAQEFTVDRPRWRDDVLALLAFWKDLTRYYYGKDQPSSQNLYASRVLKSAIVKFAVNNLEIAFANFLDDAPWPAECVAGRRIAVLYPEGDLAVCELRKRVVNIRDYDLDVHKAMTSPQFKDEVARVPGDKCYCTHGCFIPPSVRYSPGALVRMAVGGRA